MLASEWVPSPDGTLRGVGREWGHVACWRTVSFDGQREDCVDYLQRWPPALPSLRVLATLPSKGWTRFLPPLDSGVSLGLALTNNRAEVAPSEFQSLGLRCLQSPPWPSWGPVAMSQSSHPWMSEPQGTGAQRPPAQPGPSARLCEATVGSQVQLNPSCNPTGHTWSEGATHVPNPKNHQIQDIIGDYVWRCFSHSRSVTHTPTVTLWDWDTWSSNNSF